MTPVDPTLLSKLERFGMENAGACFNCGHCTATCSLTDTNDAFPRRAIQYAQLGLREKLEASVEPWLCYYCGDCTQHCPRQVDPAAQMMAFRRYLTAAYDWTGLASRFYTSKAWEVGAIVAVALLVVALFVVPHALNPGHVPTELAVNPDGTTYVALNTFAPVRWVHLGDWILVGLLGALLLCNLFRMYRKILGGEQGLRIRPVLFVREAWRLLVHFVTQRRFADCDRDLRPFWAAHLLLMSGYVIMFSLVVLLLPEFQIDAEGINWTTYLGYYATLALLAGCVFFAAGRLRKKDEVHKRSHFTDWTFLILLSLTVLTGIAGHVFRYYLQWPLTTYAVYVVHLAVAVPMLLVEVPFGKWAHLVYRPFAIYFAALRATARRDAVKVHPLRVAA
jgi:ferredoxin